MTRGTVRRAITAVLAGSALLLAGCAAGPSLGNTGIVVGTALPVTSLDPAAAAGAGGDLVAEQIYPHLVTGQPGGSRLEPDIAESARFDGTGAYVVTLKPGLEFANGDRLDASDVVFSFTRQRTIKAPGGPSPLLAGIASVTARDDRTVVFTLTTPNDQSFPAILASAAGAIVDERVFPARALASDEAIVAARPFAGPYVVQSFNPGDLLTFVANPAYAGGLGAPRSADVTLKLYADPGDLAADVADQAIDLAYGGLAPAQLRTLREDPAVRIDEEPGGALHYLVFDLNAMPYGELQSSADPQRSLAVRRAIADLVDREAIARAVDAGTTAPLWGFTSNDLPGAEPVLRSITGDGKGEPDQTAAQRELDAAGVEIPVPLTISTIPELYGTDSSAEYEALAAQLEASGLFTVHVRKVGAAEFAAQRPKGAYQAYQGGWSPRSLDPVTYRAPYLLGDAQLGSHYTNPTALALLAKPATDADPTVRAADLTVVQEQLAADLPVLPLLQDEQLTASASGVRGVRFDGSLTLRFGSLRVP
jgi:peptide/nickel transport system substrate-binding protein